MDLNKILINLAELHCKDCKNFLTTPIIISKDGKNLCGQCSNNAAYPDDYVNNEALEIIIKQLNVPCRYKNFGCSSLQKYTDATEHEKACQYRQYQCFTNEPCTWSGSYDSILQHFENRHKDLLIHIESEDFSVYINISEAPKFKTLLIIFKNQLFLLQIFIASHCTVFFNLSSIKLSEGEEYEYSLEEIIAPNLLCAKQGIKKSVKNIDNGSLDGTIEIDLSVFEIFNFNRLEAKIKILGEKEPEDEKILENFECPICQDYMLPPIFQCSNGHCFCKFCRGKIMHCPICQTRLTQMRNIALEKISSHVYFPCSYLHCQVKLPGSEIEKHQRICVYSDK